MKKIAIIGAGLSGLSAARLLNEQAEITIFEKSRGVSGRMSTRRDEPYFFDHGAQYFTARTPAFQEFILPMINEGLIKRWDAHYVKFNDSQVISHQNWADDEPRYVGVPAMNVAAKYLAQGLNIHLNTKIVSMKRENKWQLIDENNRKYNDFDWVISTIPSHQAVELLPQTFKYYSEMTNIEMQACFSLMLGFEKALPLEFEAAHINNADLSWLAINSSKPGREEPYTLMVHSSAAYAEENIDENRERVMEHLIAETSRILGHDVNVACYKNIHAWRYANNTLRKNHSAFVDRELNLAACGDWCVGGRVEGAFTSAYNVAASIKEYGL